MFEILMVLSLAIIFVLVVKKLPEIEDIAYEVKRRKSKNGAADLYENETAESLEEKAQLAFDAKNYELAEKLFIALISRDPKNTDAFNKLGVLYLNMGHYPDAREAFNHVVSVEPRNSFAWNNLGLVFYHQSKYKQAIEAYKQAIGLDSTVASRYINLGLTYEALRKYTEALESYKKAVILDPENEDYKKVLSELKNKVAQ